MECPICRDRNLPADHRSGGKSCPSVRKGKRGLDLNFLAKRTQVPLGGESRAATPALSTSANTLTPHIAERRMAEEEEGPRGGGSGKRRRLKHSIVEDTGSASEMEAEPDDGKLPSDEDDL